MDIMSQNVSTDDLNIKVDDNYGRSVQFGFCSTGRESDKVAYIEAYLKANKLLRDYTNSSQDPVFTKVSGSVFYIHRP